MKNTDPPHRNNHKPPGLRLTPELHAFIRHMGAYFETNGVPRIGGMILGLLILADRPLNAEQIAATLKISRASVSTNFRLLAAAGLAERYTSHEDRITYYEFPAGGWEQMLRISEQQTQVMQSMIAEALAAVPRQHPTHRRLELGFDLTDMLLQVFRKSIEEWRARQDRVPAR